MPQRKSESVELMTITDERCDDMIIAQRAAYKRIKGEMSQTQFLDTISTVTTILGLLFKIPTVVGVGGAVAAITDKLVMSEKEIVLNSINNGLHGLAEIKTEIKKDPSRNYIRAYVGFLNFDNLGFRTVSSEYPDFL